MGKSAFPVTCSVRLACRQYQKLPKRQWHGHDQITRFREKVEFRKNDFFFFFFFAPKGKFVRRSEFLFVHPMLSIMANNITQ